MQKILICSDKYKGCLTSGQVNKAIHDGIVAACHHALCDLVTVSDGGDGFLAAIPELELLQFPAYNALLEPITATIGYKSAVVYIEIASIIGFAMLKNNPGTIWQRSSYGLGKLIHDILNSNLQVQKIVIACGGSSTNDSGFGCLLGLGAEAFDENDNLLPPQLHSIDKIKRIDASAMHPKLKQVEIEVVADVRGDLLGKHGCTHTFARQKGATNKDLPLLENLVLNFQQQILNNLGVNLSSSGYGLCSGGLAALFSILPLVHYFDGAAWVIRHTNLEAKIAYCDMVFSGEGMVDATTLHGKLLYHIARLCKMQHKPLIVIAGQINCDLNKLYNLGITTAFPIINHYVANNNLFAGSDKLITDRVRDLFNFYNANSLDI